MNNRRLGYHFALAFTILAACLIIFAPSPPPNKFNPEDLSPYAYLLAALIGFYILAKNKLNHSVWAYLPIPLLSFFGFLEEISYGVEIGLFEPIRWQKYGVDIYDAHNIVPFIHNS